MEATTTEERVVSGFVFDPSNSIFKSRANEHAEFDTITCVLGECPLRDNGQCMLAPAIGWTRCPYGKHCREIGPTRRSNKFRRWVSDRKDSLGGIRQLSAPQKKLAFVGTYVYLPYSFMTMCIDVPFVAHLNLISLGTCLISVNDWTLSNVIKLVDFVPRAIFGYGAIVEYQRDVVPMFVQHMRELDYDMWEKLVSNRPEIDKQPNYVKRTAILSTLRCPISWTTEGGNRSKYPVSWLWDGEYVTTSSLNAYNSTWGDLKLNEIVELKAKPDQQATIVVRHNDWVKEDTVFLD